MRFAGAGWGEEVDDLTAIDELELGESEEALAVEGWKEKSKPASVLIVARRPMRSAVLIRLFSRTVSSSARSMSISSSALASPRSSWRTAWSSISGHAAF
jgi:hypothetical protein